MTIKTGVGLVVLLIVALNPFFGIGTGFDFIVHYRQLGAGDTWIPLYGYWLIWPFAVMPPFPGLLAWNITNMIGFLALAWRFKSNLILSASSFPALYLFGNGQIGGLIAAGLAMAMSPNPWLAGLGLVLASIKPQISILALAGILLCRRDIKILVLPVLVVLASFVFYGFWPLAWLESIRGDAAHLGGQVWNVSLFPISLFLLILAWHKRGCIRYLLLITPLIAPYFAFYSLAVPLLAARKWITFWAVWVIGIAYVLSGHINTWILGGVLLWEVAHNEA